MTDSRLVTPDQIEDLAAQVLRDRHEEHLAKLERLRGLRPRTLTRLRTIAHVDDADGQRRPGDRTMPAVLLGVIGVDGLEPDETDALNGTFKLGLQVSVLGRNRRDVRRRRDWTAFAVVECLLQRLPRASDLVHAVTLTDYEPISSGDHANVLADARVVLDVEVEHFISPRGLPPVDTDWPAGGPGGAPPDGEPYTPPEPPPTATTIGSTLEREPLVE